MLTIEVHDAKNLFVTDGACMTSSSCVNRFVDIYGVNGTGVRFAAGQDEKGRAMNRRTFLGTITAGSMVASQAWSWAIAGRKLDAIGVQLYTVRNAMKADLPGTIARGCADPGYQRKVEFAGYFDHSPKEIRSVLDQNNLSAPSAHIPLRRA